jgi:hypothetical protein
MTTMTEGVAANVGRLAAGYLTLQSAIHRPRPLPRCNRLYGLVPGIFGDRGAEHFTMSSRLPTDTAKALMILQGLTASSPPLRTSWHVDKQYPENI